MNIFNIGFLIFFVINSSCFSQTTDSLASTCLDTVELKGYFVRVYDQEEIKSTEKNKRLKENGKPYQIPIDYSVKSFFIPYNKDLYSNLNSILKADKDSIFLLCKKSLIQSYCGDDTLTSIECNNPNFKNVNFYSIPSNKKHCFQISELEGKWIKTNFKNTNSNRRELGVSGFYVSPDSQNINAFILSGYTSFRDDPEIKDSRIKVFKTLNLEL